MDDLPLPLFFWTGCHFAIGWQFQCPNIGIRPRLGGRFARFDTVRCVRIDIARGLDWQEPRLGGSTQAAGASVRVQVIDLEALDQSILQAAELSRSDRSSTLDTSGQKFDSSMARSFDTERFSSSRPASYDYMAVLNHPHDPTIIRDYAGDVRFFLEQARKARDGGRWSGAQVYYDQAWSRLSQAQKSQVLQELAKVQEQRAKRAKEGTPAPKP